MNDRQLPGCCKGAVIGVLLLLTACDLSDALVTPARDDARLPASLMVSIAPAEGRIGAMQQTADRIWIHVTDRTDVLADTTVSRPVAASEVRLRIEVDLRGATDSLTVTVELRDGSLPVARAIHRQVVEAGRTNTVLLSASSTEQTIAAGLFHTCALALDGSTYCWGDHTAGQLGHAGRRWLGEAIPARIEGAEQYRSITAASTFTCAIDGVGAAYCWGLNDLGQLGNGTAVGAWPSAQPAPIRVAGGVPFASLSAGGYDWSGSNHVCGLTRTGEAYCWGANGAGQLGNGSVARAMTPTPVASAVRFSVIHAGDRFTCALDDEGRAHCWGANESGQLGNGTTQDALIPVRVETDLRFVTIASGRDHACAVETTGALHCWGSNLDGQLGIGEWGGASQRPQRVATTGSFVAVSLGYSFSCALRSDGSAYCWGNNHAGRLGIGEMLNTNIPAIVAGGAKFRNLSTGAGHACGVTTQDQILCWGDVSRGALGDGSIGYEPRPILAGISEPLTSLSAGFDHTCGIDSAARAWCWGVNFYGQLGFGVHTWYDEVGPRLVAGNVEFSSLSAGLHHTCGIDRNGVVFCWGSNNHGQLGVGIIDFGRPAPVSIPTGLTFDQVSAGFHYTCALSAGDAFCWGRNDRGQLGNGSTIGSAVPTPVAGNLQFSAIAAGPLHTCGVDVAGQAYCWGDNTHGQLGNGTTLPSTTPVRVAGGHPFYQIDPGGYSWQPAIGFTCGLTTSGEVYCWGPEQGCVLGIGPCAIGPLHAAPVRVLSSGRFRALSAGTNHACGLTSGGTVQCWGTNLWGELAIAHNGDLHGAWTTDSGSGVPFTSLAGPIASLSTFGGFTCAIEDSSSVRCWGDIGYDQLGDGRVRFVLSPKPILGGILR